MSYIHSVESVFPSNYYSQEELLSVFKKLWAKKYFNLDRLESFHKNVLVSGRHLALPIEKYSDLLGFKKKNDAWIETALEMATRATTELFDKHNIDPSAISAIFSTTITGLAVPSLEARLMNKIKFNSNVKRIPMFGLGCLAGAAGINRCADYLKAYPKQAVLFISIELCSLTLQQEDLSIQNIISTGLFGDGGAVVLMVGDEHPLAKNSPLRHITGSSHFFPESEDIMGWDIIDTGFKIVLNEKVPHIAQNYMPDLIEKFLSNNQTSLDKISFHVAHPGGPKVLMALEQALNLKNGELKHSWNSLKEYGNMSSSSVLFVLRETINDINAGRIDLKNKTKQGLIMAMGPAFCTELSLIEIQ